MYLSSPDGDYFRNVPDKSIQQQLADGDTSVRELFWYSIFYVMTVYSTVGYGSHSYDQTEEYIVATVFIIAASFFAVLPYYVSRKYGMLL